MGEGDPTAAKGRLGAAEDDDEFSDPQRVVPG
jgi:hypothetical protein